MVVTMDKIFQNLIDNNFSDLKGLTVDASIPVPQGLINEIVESALRGNKNIDSCRVSIHEQNRVSVDLKTILIPWPLNLKLRLDKSVDLKGSPKIRASLENNLLLGTLGSFFKGLQKWITISANQVVIDVGALLRPQEQKYLELIKSAEITTGVGKVKLNAKIGVD
jgi:hypothetical protein